MDRRDQLIAWIQAYLQGINLPANAKEQALYVLYLLRDTPVAWEDSRLQAEISKMNTYVSIQPGMEVDTGGGWNEPGGTQMPGGSTTSATVSDAGVTPGSLTPLADLTDKEIQTIIAYIQQNQSFPWQLVKFLPMQYDANGNLIFEGGLSPISAALLMNWASMASMKDMAEQATLDRDKLNEEISYNTRYLAQLQAQLAETTAARGEENAIRRRQLEQEERRIQIELDRLTFERDQADKQLAETQYQFDTRMNFDVAQLKQMGEQFAADLELQKMIASGNFLQAAQRMGLEKELAYFQGAMENPYAFAAYNALQQQQQVRQATEEESKRFAEEQNIFEQASQARQMAQAEYNQLVTGLQQWVNDPMTVAQRLSALSPAALARERENLGRFGVNIDAFLRLGELSPIVNAPGPIAPVQRAITPRQVTPYETELADVGFQMPFSAGPGTTMQPQQFFGQGIPTLGSLGSLTPESQEFLTSTLGYQGVSPGSFLELSSGITPAVEPLTPRKRILPAEMAGISR